jgi:serine protease
MTLVLEDIYVYGKMEGTEMKNLLVLVTVLIGSLSQAADSVRYMIAFKQPTSAMMAPQKAQLQLDAQKLMAHLQSSQFKGQIESKLNKLNSVIVQINDSAEVAALRSSPAVEFVDKEVFRPSPKPVLGNIGPAMLSPLAAPRGGDKTPWGIKAVKAMEAWALSNSGKGARVLILDTGIDKDHPAVAANFEAGQAFTSAADADYPYFDDQGHGTHVAGTIAASLAADGFTGVAPQAKILMGRVCAHEGCSNLAVAAGINWGVEQHVDVVSMSLGGGFASPSERKAVTAALKAGITIVAASGNSGESNVSYPAALAGVIAVGAIDINKQKASFSQYGPELAVVAPGVDVISSVPQGTGRDSEVKLAIGSQAFEVVPSSTFSGSQSPVSPVVGELVEAGLGKPADFANKNIRGKFALVQRGEIMFAEKAQNAINAGATGLIVFNNAPGLIRGAITQDGSVLSIPVFMVEQTVGQALIAAMNKGQVAKASLLVVPTDYSSFDGTSMATPHVSGVVALMKAANKNLTPAQVKQILQATALRLQPNSNNELGAGLVDAEKAVQQALTTATPLMRDLN